MNTETTEAAPTTEQLAFVPERQEQAITEGYSLDKLFLQLVAVAAGILIGAVLAMFLALNLGWVGC